MFFDSQHLIRITYLLQKIGALIAGIISGITSILIIGLIVVFSSQNPKGDPHVGWSILVFLCILMAITNTISLVISYLIHQQLKARNSHMHITMVQIFGTSLGCMIIFSLTLALIQGDWYYKDSYFALAAFLVGFVCETVYIFVYKRMTTT